MAPGRISLDQLRDRERAKVAPRVRWYLGYRGRGRADQVVEGISRFLNQRRLTDTVCGMRMERRARGEFYFFLTLETDHFGVFPDEVGEALDACPLLSFRAGGPYELREIQNMVSGELKIKALGQCLTYRRMRQEVAEDPFHPGTVTTERGLGEQAERLLWYLSAVGSGSWSTFRAACAALGVGDAARQLARNLRLLGHLELSADGERWSVTPPACVRVRGLDGSALRFWTGARSANAQGEKEPQPFGPPRLSALEPVDGERDDPAARLAELLPTLDEYRAGLSEVGGVSGVQQFAKCDGDAFKPTAFAGEPGLYEVTQGGRTLTLLYSRGRWLKGDGYGLRFLNLWETGLLIEARYDPATWALALPTNQRPPELYERALVLCSGLLPERQPRWLRYRHVPPGVAHTVAARLELTLRPPNAGEVLGE
jgi:hypothetical protein